MRKSWIFPKIMCRLRTYLKILENTVYIEQCCVSQIMCTHVCPPGYATVGVSTVAWSKLVIQTIIEYSMVGCTPIPSVIHTVGLFGEYFNNRCLHLFVCYFRVISRTSWSSLITSCVTTSISYSKELLSSAAPSSRFAKHSTTRFIWLFTVLLIWFEMLLNKFYSHRNRLQGHIHDFDFLLGGG